MLAGPPQAKRVLPPSQRAYELAMGRYAMARDARRKLPRRTKDDNASRIRAWRQAPSSGSAVSLIQQASVLASLTLTWRSGIASEYLSIRTIRTASSGSFESAWCNYAKGVLLRSCTLLRTSFPGSCSRCETPETPFRLMLTRPVTTVDRQPVRLSLVCVWRWTGRFVSYLDEIMRVTSEGRCD